MSNHRPTTRRDVLKQIAVSTAAGAVPAFGQASVSRQPYQYRFFSPIQVGTLEILTELIIPTDDHSPGAKDAGVPQYLDIIASGSSQEVQERWTNGLASLDDLAQQRFRQSFAALPATRQVELLEQLAASEDQPASNLEHFFVIVKRATIEGYYTSPIGIHKEIEYQGNSALATFPGCTHSNDAEPHGDQL